MRYNVLKKYSTKPERVVYEVLKQLNVPLKHRWIVKGMEVDFVVNNFAIEVNGHEQNEKKNNLLIENGFIPIHIHNTEVRNTEQLKEKLKILYEHNKTST